MSLFKNRGLKVILGISGGIDSAVAGLLLKKQGYDVQGVFMRNWDVVDETGNCSADQDLQAADKTCSMLGISLHEVNFSKDYWIYVFTDLMEQYQSGKTPNPDILCNRHIKFNKFIKYSFHKFRAEAIATGHYAQTSFGKFLEFYDKSKGVHLLKAVDLFKDQTFFLHQVNQEALQKTMFPLGHLKKSEVRMIALENNLDYLVKKKESTGICFIGRRNFPEFISEYLPDNPGVFRDIDTGRIVGYHRGVHYWTIGQRCRIGGFPNRVYVAKKIPETQEILVALGEKHLILWSQHITTGKPHWIHSVPDVLKRGGVLKCSFRFQHTHPLIHCQVFMKSDSELLIRLVEPLSSLTPGQYAVLYKDNECLGGARIENTAPSLYCLDEFKPSNYRPM